MSITFTEAEWKRAEEWKQVAHILRETSSMLYGEALRGFLKAREYEARAKAVLG